MRRGTREALQAVQDVLLTLRSGIPGLGHPLQRGEPYRPFFIVGSGRSGNTVLRRMLCAHGDLHIPPETYVLGDVIRVFRRHRGLLWRDLVPLVLGKFEFYPEFVTFDVSLRPLARRVLPGPRRVAGIHRSTLGRQDTAQYVSSRQDSVSVSRSAVYSSPPGRLRRGAFLCERGTVSRSGGSGPALAGFRRGCAVIQRSACVILSGNSLRGTRAGTQTAT